MKLILYKSQENYKNPDYGICVFQDLIDEVVDHINGIKESENINGKGKEVNLEITKEEIESLIKSQQGMKLIREEINGEIKSVIDSHIAK